MQTRQLGNSDLMITPLGVGAWAMGGSGWAFSWGPQDDNDSIAATRAGLDAGLNWIDTAAVYGLGHSEEVVGRAIKGVSPKPYIFTKCERIWDSTGQILKSLKKDSIERECEASLKRLNIDTIDLYQIHWPEPDEDLEEGWEALVRLKEAGRFETLAFRIVMRRSLHAFRRSRCRRRCSRRIRWCRRKLRNQFCHIAARTTSA